MYINTSYCVDLDLVASHILVCVCRRPCACTHMFAFIPYTHITYECGWLAKVCMCVCVCAHMSAGSPFPFSIFLFLIPLFILFPFPFNQRPLSFSLNFLISIYLSIYFSIIHYQHDNIHNLDKLNKSDYRQTKINQYQVKGLFY